MPQRRQGLRWLNREEQQRLLACVHQGGKLRDIAVVQLVLYTGVRVGELCGLLWADVHLTAQHGTLRVHGTHFPRRGGHITLPRHVPLNAIARQTLQEMGYAQYRNKPTAIFIGQRGPLTPRGVEILIDTYARTVGMIGVSPDTLRHTFCKNLVDVGADLIQVAALAGYPTLEAARLYFAEQSKDLQQLVERLV